MSPQDTITAVLLKRIRKRLEPESAWIQHRLALDKAGAPVPPTSQDAVCWCVLGALRKESRLVPLGYQAGPMARDILAATASTLGMGPRDLTTPNDHYLMTHAKVLEWIDNAIREEAVRRQAP